MVCSESVATFMSDVQRWENKWFDLRLIRTEHGTANECSFCPFNASKLDLSNINHFVANITTEDSDLLAKMKQHLRNEHPMSEPEYILCACKYKSATKREHKEHRNINVPENERKVPLCKRLLIENVKVVCGHCGLAFGKAYIDQHCAKEHGVNVEETMKYACSECPKRFRHLFILKTHLAQVHFPDKSRGFRFSSRKSYIYAIFCHMYLNFMRNSFPWIKITC